MPNLNHRFFAGGSNKIMEFICCFCALCILAPTVGNAAAELEPSCGNDCGYWKKVDYYQQKYCGIASGQNCIPSDNDPKKWYKCPDEVSGSSKIPSSCGGTVDLPDNPAICRPGYYGPIFSECVECPNGGTSDANLNNPLKNDSITDCYQTTGSDSAGNFEYVNALGNAEKCYYTN
jgi:hypothetical protein